MAKAIKVEWNTVRQHRAHLQVPDDFESDDYDMPALLAELNEDDCETGAFARTEIDVYPFRSDRLGTALIVIPGLLEFRLP